MNRSTIFSKLVLTLVLLLSLVLAAQATPRVGLVRVLKGKVDLDGTPICTPHLVEQGQILTLQPGAQVRVQLLGSGKELRLYGQRTWTVDKAYLEQNARVVNRGDIAALPDIGNTTRGASVTARKTRAVRGFRFYPQAVDRGDVWEFPASLTKTFFIEPPPRQIDWALVQVQMEASVSTSQEVSFRGKTLAQGQIDPNAPSIPIEHSLLSPGQRYLFSFTIIHQASEPNKDSFDRYIVPFRLLTLEEKALLTNLEDDAVQRSRGQEGVLALLELSSTYLEWDQIDDAARIFRQAQLHPGWTQLDADIKQKTKPFQWTLDEIADLPVSDGK